MSAQATALHAQASGASHVPLEIAIHAAERALYRDQWQLTGWQLAGELEGQLAAANEELLSSYPLQHGKNSMACSFAVGRDQFSCIGGKCNMAPETYGDLAANHFKPLKRMQTLLYRLTTMAACLGMALVAWLTHKYIMHGLLWVLHKDHHNPAQKDVGKE